MKFVFWYGIISTLVCWCHCQYPTLVINVFEVVSTSRSDLTLVCNVPSSTNLTRWTYLSGPTGTSLMSFQNGRCTLSPSDSFFNIPRYSYTCNNTVHQVTFYPYLIVNRHILACRDAVQPDESGSTWMFKVVNDEEQCNCDSTITLSIREITEGENVTFIYRVVSGVAYVNWNKNIGSNTAAMSGQNGQCTTQGTTFLDNSSKYGYICNTTVYQLTVLNIQRIEHNDMYMCTPLGQTEVTGSNWIIKVKAAVTSVTITSSGYPVNVKENTSVEFTCTTSTARPAASVYWYRNPNGNWQNVTQITENITTTTDYNDFSVLTSILRFVPTRQDNDTKMYCAANNSVNASPVYSRKILLIVLYKAEEPYITQGNEYHVIENTSGTLFCTVKGGNPTPTLSWSCNSFSPTNQTTINSNGNVTTTLTWKVSRTHEGTCTCTSTQTNFTTKTIDVSLKVLYPPSKPVFIVYGSSVDGDISFIEGNSGTINCTSDSKPQPDNYTWTGPSIVGSMNIQSLSLSNIKKTDAGEYKCSVHNTINPSTGGSVAGMNSSTVNVVVLYPPMVLPMNDISKQNGTRLYDVCNFTAGIPNTTLITWTRDIDDRKWNNATLNIESLKKSDTGIYTCTASNTMEQTGDDKSYISQHNRSLHLNVQYAASITSFTIDGFTSQTVIVNENNTVGFICNADSNPTAMMTLSYGRKMLKTVTSNRIEYNIATASCLDAGNYYCSAQNMHTYQNESHNTLQLFVNCSPRVGGDVAVNITSERDKTATIVFNVIAYPPPTFTWYQLVGGNWTLLHDSDHIIINSANLQSNLTIPSVGINDFTSYKVVAVNELGQMEHIYTLSPYDKPDPPTRFRHIEGRTTTSSIHIEWEPGFDKGPSQTFYIKYKKSSDTVWNYLSVSDNGEPTMNITLNGLLENTQYDVIIYASNVKGNSTESSVLITRTKAIHNPTSIPGALIGGIAGGVTGCIVIVIVIVFIIRRYRLFKGNGADGQKIRSVTSRENSSTEDLAYSTVFSVNNYEMVNLNNVESTPYALLGHTEQNNIMTSGNGADGQDIRSFKSRKNNSSEDSAYSTVSSVHNYEMVNLNNVESTPYSTLDQTEQHNVMTSDTLSKSINDEYENMKIHVI